MRRLFLLIVGLCLISSAALAVDFTTVLTDLNGKPIPNCPEPPDVVSGGKPMPKPPCTSVWTLSALAVAVLTADRIDNPTPEQKLDRYSLAMRINHAKDYAPKSAEVTLLEKLIGKTAPTVLYGRAVELLDPADLKK